MGALDRMGQATGAKKKTTTTQSGSGSALSRMGEAVGAASTSQTKSGNTHATHGISPQQTTRKDLRKKGDTAAATNEAISTAKAKKIERADEADKQTAQSVSRQRATSIAAAKARETARADEADKQTTPSASRRIQQDTQSKDPFLSTLLRMAARNTGGPPSAMPGLNVTTKGVQETVGGTVAGAGLKSAAGVAGAAGTALAAAQALDQSTSANRRKLESAQKNLETYTANLAGARTNADRKRWQALVDAAARQVKAYGGQTDSDAARLQPAIDRANQAYTNLSLAGERAIEDAKEGKGAVGRTLIDAGVAGTQMAGDALLNLMAPGASLAGMGVRSFGDASQQARMAGADIGQQLAYGGAVAGTEILSEKLFDGLAGIYGGGAADELVDSLIKSHARTAAGQRALKALSSAGGEALEEVFSGAIDPGLQSIYNGRRVSSNYGPDTLRDIGHDALIGAILGGVGGVGQVATGQFVPEVRRNPASEASPINEARTTADTAGNLPPEDSVPMTGRETAQTRPRTYAEHLQQLNEIKRDQFGTLQYETPVLDAAQAQQSTAEPGADIETPILDAAQALQTSRPQASTQPASNPESHIDRRSMDAVAKRSMSAFQFEHPELRPYYAEAAQSLIADADASLSMPLSRRRTGGGIQQSAQTSEQLRLAMDEARLTRQEVIDAAQRLINDKGQENVAAAKRLELILDDMLSHGYRDMYGNQIPPNAEYQSIKQGISGASVAPEAGSWEAYLADNRLALESGDATEAELRQEWEDTQRAQTARDDSGGQPGPEEMTYQQRYEQAGEEAVREVVDAINRGESAIDMLHKASAADQDYDSLQASKPYGEPYTEEEMIRLHKYRLLESFYIQAAENPEEAKTMFMDAFSDLFQQDRVSESDTGTPTPEGTVGSARAGYSVTQGEQVPTQNRTVTDSEYMTDEEKERLRPGTHERVTEAMSQERARQNFFADSDGNIVNLNDTVDALLDKDTWTGVEQDTAQMAQKMLIADARKTGDWRRVIDLGKAIEEIGGTAAGRSLQARQKWIKTPEGIVSRAAKVLESAGENTDIPEVLGRISDLAYQFEDAMDSGDYDALANLIRETSRIRRTGNFFTNKWSQTMNDALSRVVEQAKAGDQSAADFLEKHVGNGLVAIAADHTPVAASTALLTVRRNAMLSKTATVLRNLVSNNVFDIVDSVSRDVSALVDMMISRTTGTRSVAWDRSWFSAAKRKGSLDRLSRSILSVGLDVDTEGATGKYENGGTRTGRMTDGPAGRLLSTWEKYMGYALNSTDQFQQGGIDAEIQRGLDELYAKGLIKDDTLRNGGATEALYRTFQDETALSKLSISARRALNHINTNLITGGDAGIGLGDIALPFAQVPSNLAARAIEYSPVGIANGMIQLGRVLTAAHNGTLTAAQQARAVQTIGRGLNGTALIGAFAALAAKGILDVADNGRDEEDKDKAALSKQSGRKGTQINLSALERWANGEDTEWRQGDLLHSVGYLDPINAMMTVGSLIADDYKPGDGISPIVKATLDGTIQSVLDLPVMSTLKDTAEAYHYSTATTEGGKLIDAGMQFGAGQLSSIVPNALKGIAQGTDEYQRDAYTGDTLRDQIVDSFKAGVPGLRQTLPVKLDSYGQPMRNEPGIMGFLNANVTPGTWTHYEKPQAKITDELDRLNDRTGDNGVYPNRKAPNSVTSDGEKLELNAEEKRRYQQTAGKEFLGLAQAMIQSSSYGSLSDRQKADALSSAVVYANAKARQQLIKSHGGSYELSGEARTVEKAVEAKQEGIDPARYFVLKAAHDKIGEGTGTANEKATRFAQYLSESGLNDAQQAKAMELLSYSSGFKAEANQRALDAVEAGTISLDEYYSMKADIDAYLEETHEGKSLSKGRLVDYLNTNVPSDQRHDLFELFQGGGEKNHWKNPY